MHGMLSLAVLVAAFACVAVGAVYVSVRLYRAGSASRRYVADPAPETPLEQTR
ncbi:MAG TPA: hypothetical protein VGS62_10425 [Streptosporangiaceae bacterium]|nr:hypothetical protein [Streptosporangiaceae bacterium]